MIQVIWLTWILNYIRIDLINKIIFNIHDDLYKFWILNIIFEYIVNIKS